MQTRAQDRQTRGAAEREAAPGPRRRGPALGLLLTVGALLAPGCQPSPAPDLIQYRLQLPLAPLLAQARVTQPHRGAVGPRTLLLERTAVDAISAHPDTAIWYPNLFLQPDSRLVARVGLAPEARTRPGDGVFFQVKVRDQGRETLVLERRVDPFHRVQDRRWIEMVADLSPFGNRKVDLGLVTARGQDRRNDRALWLEPAVVRQATNVLLITADTLRADHLGCYGSAETATPHLDRLAAEGVLFEQCYAQTNTTNPSHASILTSLYLKDHGLYKNQATLPDAPPTLAEVFHQAGYLTAGMVSAAHLNPPLSGFDRGFDQFFPCPTLERRAEETNRVLLPWLERHRHRPFFLWVHYFDPHFPYAPPPPFDTRYYAGDPRDPSHRSLAGVPLPDAWWESPYGKTLKGITDLNFVLAQYRGEVSYLDRELGRLFQQLRRLEIDERTLVVFVADHGELLGERGVYFSHVGLYEETAHVPLILRPPAGTAFSPGSRVEDLVETVDLFPTLVDLLRLPAPEGLRGRSLVPTLTGGRLAPRPVFCEHANQWVVGARTPEWTYLKTQRDIRHHPRHPFRKGQRELYHRRTDPRELQDRSADRPAVVQEFDALVAAWQADHRTFAPSPIRPTEQDLRNLRQLGYADHATP